MMRPNQTRLRVFSAVLRLESFTVAELCLLSGLEASKVYRELSDLQVRKILIPTSAVPDGKTPPRHRPPQRYHFVDPSKRTLLRKDLLSFVPDQESEKAPPNRHLTKAQESLTAINYELTTASLSELPGPGLDDWEQRLASRLENAQFDLQRASWESEKDFSEAKNSDDPVVLAQHLYERLNDQFQTLVRAERNRALENLLRGAGQPCSEKSPKK